MFFSNENGSSIVMAIAGSDDLPDWIGANPSFISPHGPTQALTNDVTAAAAILNEIKSLYPNANIVLTGHSLGGAIAQILANATGLATTTFDAPGVGGLVAYFTSLTQQLSNFSAPSISSPITNYRIYGDLVSTVGNQLGTLTTVTFEPPISKLLIDQFPLSTAKPLHDLSYMLERVVDNAATTSSTGPTAAGVIADTGGLLGATLIGDVTGGG